MTDLSQFLEAHGAPILFGVIFIEQLGLPIPGVPCLLAAGALARTGQFNLVGGLIITVVACAIPDAIWFYLGRHRGGQVLNFLCRISLEPDSCVRKTQNLFTKYGMPGVIIAKFLPGFSTMAPPLAGMAGVNAARFLLVDGFASLLYGLCFIGAGFLFSNQIHEITAVISNLGGNALSLLGALVAIYIGFKFWRRQRLLRELRMARITAAELRQRQIAGDDIFILDLRSSEELHRDGAMIDGAIHLRVDDVEHRHSEIPRDREIVLYCSCPNEVTSARIALLLRRKGITRVRPLLGGIDTWRELQYPLAQQPAVA